MTWRPYIPSSQKIPATFIIPVSYDHEDRKTNLMLTVVFLRRYFDCEIIIGENNGNEFEFMHNYVRYYKFNYPQFHRTKILNDLTRLVSKEIVVNWDSDNILSPQSILSALQCIKSGADVVYPFDGKVVRVPRHLIDSVIRMYDIGDVDESKCRLCYDSVGHAVVYNKDAYWSAGGENESFISWGKEDKERWYRFNALLKVERVAGTMYHIDHYCGLDSNNKNAYYAANDKEYDKVFE